ncbi:MAG: transcription factor S [Thermoprotei archaeon]
MRFCPHCGSVLRTQRKAGVIVQICPKCGYEEPVTKKSSDSPPKPARVRSDQPAIVENENSNTTSLSKTKAVCPKCGNGEAYWWMQQTRSADEATTRFFRCTKCGHVWREYD